MKQFFILSFCLLVGLTSNVFTVENERDWTLDPKTSTLIPKYLGKIKAISGKAIIGDRELKKGSKIYNNDLIETMEKSFIVMEMIDLTIVTLGPKSEFKVDNWAYRTKNDRDAQFNILKGQWRALIKSKSKDSDQLKIKTSLVSMGVRGTELMVNVLNIDGKDVTQVALLEGVVHMEGETPELKKDLSPGDHVTIIKSEKGFEHKDRKLDPLEMKSYQEYMAPDVIRLLDPVKLETNASKISSKEIIGPEKTNTFIDPNFQNEKKSKSVQENLQILNTTREENRKK